MTQAIQMEEVAKILHRQHRKLYFDYCPFLNNSWEHLSDAVREAFRGDALEILSKVKKLHLPEED